MDITSHEFSVNCYLINTSPAVLVQHFVLRAGAPRVYPRGDECIAILAINANPEVWNEDIGEE